MNLQERATQSAKIARASIGNLSDERLAETWMLTNGQRMTDELPVVRGWLLDELEIRMGRMDVWVETCVAPADEHRDADRDRFGTWLEDEFAAGQTPVSPLPYLS